MTGISSDAYEAFLAERAPSSALPPLQLYVSGPNNYRKCVVPGCFADTIGDSKYINNWWLEHARADHAQLLLPKDRQP